MYGKSDIVRDKNRIRREGKGNLFGTDNAWYMSSAIRNNNNYISI